MWPYFVAREVDKFLPCGCLEDGILRLSCQHCRVDRLVPPAQRQRFRSLAGALAIRAMRGYWAPGLTPARRRRLASEPSTSDI